MADQAIFVLVVVVWGFLFYRHWRFVRRTRDFLARLDLETGGQLPEWIYPHDPIQQRALGKVFERARVRLTVELLRRLTTRRDSRGRAVRKEYRTPMPVHISDNLSTDPSETSTQTLGAIGAKGSGKSYLAGVIVEGLFDAGCPVLVLDPIGNWGRGLRLSADGKSPGLPIGVIGGEHGDIPLDATQGAAIGQFLRQREASAVIDISELSKRKRKEFVADLCEAIFRESRRQKSPFMVVLEEAHLFAPQRLMAGEERMFGAVADIVRLGRNYGLGVLLVTQRPQSISKEVFNQIECLFVGSMRGPHERSAVKDWVKEQGVDDQVREMLADLPKLKAGDFYLWSPSWLERFEKIRVGKKRTYDGSSTPVLGKKRERAAPLAPIDLGELRALMETPAEDLPEGPKPTDSAGKSAGKGTGKNTVALVNAEQTEQLRILKQENDELRRDKASLEVSLHDVLTALAVVHGEFRDTLGELGKVIERPLFHRLLEQAPEDRREVERRAPEPLEFQPWQPGESLGLVLAKSPAREKRAASADGGLSTPEYQCDVLAAIAHHGPLARVELSIVTLKSLSSSTFAGAIRQLVTDGLVVDRRGEGLVATGEGQRAGRALGAPELGRGLYDAWLRKLDDYDGKTFVVIATGPKAGLTRAEISKQSGHSLTSSTFAGSIRSLKKQGLCEEAGRLVRVRDETRRLFGL